MTTGELAYPVIALCEGGAMIEARSDEDALTTATAHELRKGWFDSMTIVDSDGRAVRVREARFVSGKGRFRGYTPCLNRIIRIALTLDEETSDMPLEELKAKVIAFQQASGGSMDPDYSDQVLRELADARSIRELIERFRPQMDAKAYYASLRGCRALHMLRALFRRR